MKAVCKAILLAMTIIVAPPALAADAGAKDAQVKDAKAPTTAPASAPAEPKNANEAVKMGGQAIQAGKQGLWWYMSSLICLIVMFVLKAVKVLEKIGRWKYVILPVLSLAAALLAAFQGGVTVERAIGVFTTAWAMGMLEELVSHGILGKAHS